MEFKQIQELIKAINKSNISELSIQDGEFSITIRQDGAVESELPMYGYPQMMPQMMPQQHMQMPVQPMQQPQQMTAQPNAPAAQLPPATDAGMAGGKTTTIKSPMIGTFYRSSSPDKPAFVSVGDEVKKGQVLCIIEAMKLFNEIESEVDGRIVKMLADDASPVEYDQPLFLVEPA